MVIRPFILPLEKVMLKLWKLLSLEGLTMVNAKNKNSQIPLHLAALANKRAMVMLFVKAGSNKKAKDSQGRRPYDMATDEKVKELLNSSSVPRVIR